MATSQLCLPQGGQIHTAHQLVQSLLSTSPLQCCVSPWKPLGLPAVTCIHRFELLLPLSDFRLKKTSRATPSSSIEVSPFDSCFRSFLAPQDSLPSVCSLHYYIPVSEHQISEWLFLCCSPLCHLPRTLRNLLRV